MLSRAQRLKLNTAASFLNQLINIACGFILPVLILESFGSAVNGLVSSISQFLGFISLLELGMGAVVTSALYKPLADSDTVQINKIFVSASKFFKRLAIGLLGYVIILMVIYPQLVAEEFDYAFTTMLIACMAISMFAQYYFGIVNAMLLAADQRSYVQSIINIITQILNVAACVILINQGFGIHIVKLATSLFFLLRPLGLLLYVEKHYVLDKTVKYDTEPIAQKWNGIAQHITAVVLNNTDVVILTCMSTLANVSVYAVYNLVVSGVKQLVFSLMDGVQALLGELLAKREYAKLNKVYGWTEWTIHTGSVIIWGCTAALIVPFVQVYTRSITDVSYIVPFFALLISGAHFCHCIRQSYYMLVKAAGNYKQTQNNQIITAVMNIVISILGVKLYGLAGVAAGTLIAMLYQTIWMAKYVAKNIIDQDPYAYVKQLLVDCLGLILIYSLTYCFELHDISYFSWNILAAETVLIAIIEIIFINFIFYPQYIKKLCKKIIGK